MGRNTPLPARVRRLRERIESWRAERSGHGPMPASLWDAAVALAEIHGIYAIARAIHVDFGALKQRVRAQAKPRAGQSEPAAQFIEVDPTRLPSMFEPTGMVVEVWARDGTKLVIRLSPRDALDVGSLVEKFRGRRP
jgi:hypothetical protein